MPQISIAYSSWLKFYACWLVISCFSLLPVPGSQHSTFQFYELIILSMSYISGIIQYIFFHIWLILLSIMSSKLTHATAYCRTSFLYISAILISVLLDIYLEEGFLNHVLVLFLTFWGASTVFSIETYILLSILDLYWHLICKWSSSKSHFEGPVFRATTYLSLNFSYTQCL